MDDRPKNQQEEHTEDRKTLQKPNDCVNRDAGPSGTCKLPASPNTANGESKSRPSEANELSTEAELPGAIISPKTRPVLSKSEHNIRQITTQDVTNALKSLSFRTSPNKNVKDLKLHMQKESDDAESTTLLDIKKFMASCFKLENTALREIPLQSIHVPIEVQELPNASTDTESVPRMTTNEVIVTNIETKSNIESIPATINIEPKLSKAEGKKKTSGSLSERSDVAVAQRDSLSSIGSNVCRICMTRGRERLISPCNCKGSLANVHLTCLERWLNQVGRNHCELCGFSYPAIRTPRYTVLQALRLWFGNPRNRSHLQRRMALWDMYSMESDCLIFWLLSTVTAGLLAVCIVGTQYFVLEGNKFGKLDAGSRKEEGISHRITETAMDFFMAIVLCGYSVTVYLLWKDHYVMWNRWRRANVNVRLLLAPDANPVPFVPRPRYNIV